MSNNFYYGLGTEDTDLETLLKHQMEMDIDESDDSYGLSYYQGDNERLTLDREWTEQELRDDVWDEANKILNGHDGKKGWLDRNKDRAFHDKDLVKVEYLVENILTEIDVIELYNKEVDKHRNDTDKLFGIAYFDKAIQSKIERTLKQNLVS